TDALTRREDLIRASPGQQPAIGADGQSPGGVVLAAREVEETLQARRPVPDRQLRFEASRDQPAPIRAERHAQVTSAGVSRQSEEICVALPLEIMPLPVAQAGRALLQQPGYFGHITGPQAVGSLGDVTEVLLDFGLGNGRLEQDVLV